MRVVSSVVLFAYDDGKTEKGIGTLASKSRLPGMDESRLENLPKCYDNNSKGSERDSGFGGEVDGKGGERGLVLPTTRSR